MECGTKIVESPNVTFIETLLVKLNAFGYDLKDGNDDTFLDLESLSTSLGTQEEMPETEADAEPDNDDSESGGKISDFDEERDSDVDEESDSDIDSRPSEAARPKQIARQRKQLGDYNKGPASANVITIYLSTLDCVYTIGHPLLDTPNVSNSHPRQGTTGKLYVSASSEVASIHGKSARKHVQT